MPLGREVGLGPGGIVLDGAQLDPLPQKGNTDLQFLALVHSDQTVAHLSCC